MITQKQIKLFDEKISNAKSVVLFAHKNPDGDALCSVAALGHLIELNYGKEVICMYDGNVPDNLDNIPLRRDMHYYARVDENIPVDVAIVMDYGIKRNIGGPQKFLDKAKFVIEIDHHINDDKVGDLCVDDESAAATGEIVYELMPSRVEDEPFDIKMEIRFNGFDAFIDRDCYRYWMFQIC